MIHMFVLVFSPHTKIRQECLRTEHFSYIWGITFSKLAVCAIYLYTPISKECSRMSK